MRKLKTKSCIICGVEFQPTGSCCKFCPNCRVEQRKVLARKGASAYRQRKGYKVGVGKGGATGFGKDNPTYKHGHGVFTRLRSTIKEQQRYCGYCGKDLHEATHSQWVIHHKDHNKFNNPEDGSNWILLCKKCHQVEHQCWKAFEGATTSLIRLPDGRFFNPNKRSFQEDSEKPDTLASVAEGSDIV